MKNYIATILICGTMVSAVNGSYAAPRFSIFDEWMDRKIVPPNGPLPIDEAFGSLAKQSSANVFADVTSLEEDLVVSPYADRRRIGNGSLDDTLLGVSNHLAEQARLSFDRSTRDTLVFWRRPDRQRLINLIIAYHKQLEVTYPQANTESVVAGLVKFFELNHGWSAEVKTVAESREQAAGVDANVELKDFPVELRTQIEAELFSVVRRFPVTPPFQTFETSFWKDARLRIVNPDVAVVGKNRPLAPSSTAILNLSSPTFSTAKFNIGTFSWAFRATAPGNLAPRRAKAPTGGQKRPITQPLQPFEQPAPHIQNGLLSEDAKLQVQVACDVKRKPVASLLAEFKKQTGVSLQLAPGFLSDASITASSQGMKLTDAMAALERLYSAHWTKDATGYALESKDLDELHLAMAQEGYGAHYNLTGLYEEERQQAGTELAEEIVGLVDTKQLESRDGVLFSALPSELQERVIALFRQAKASDLILAQQRLDDVMNEKVHVRLSPLPPATKSFFGKFLTAGGNIPGPLKRGATHLVAYSSQGEFIAWLFPSFKIHSLSEDELRQQNLEKQIQIQMDQERDQ
jgi:hypothetical protein